MTAAVIAKPELPGRRGSARPIFLVERNQFTRFGAVPETGREGMQNSVMRHRRRLHV